MMRHSVNSSVIILWGSTGKFGLGRLQRGNRTAFGYGTGSQCKSHHRQIWRRNRTFRRFRQSI